MNSSKMKDQKAPDLHTAVRTVATARSKAIDLLKYLANGMTNKHGEEGKKKFLSEIKLQLDTINNSFKELVKMSISCFYLKLF